MQRRRPVCIPWSKESIVWYFFYSEVKRTKLRSLYQVIKDITILVPQIVHPFRTFIQLMESKKPD